MRKCGLCRNGLGKEAASLQFDGMCDMGRTCNDCRIRRQVSCEGLSSDAVGGLSHECCLWYLVLLTVSQALAHCCHIVGMVPFPSLWKC